ncbi:MAG: ATP-binding protein [Cardiobacteriaceae bacterium]|nr:ATP-binding protein [Cardiobacteriaceae bacterium]
MKKHLRLLALSLFFAWIAGGGWWLYYSAPAHTPLAEILRDVRSIARTAPAIERARLIALADRLETELGDSDQAHAQYKMHRAIYLLGITLGLAALLLAFARFYISLDRRVTSRTADLKQAYDELAASQMRLIHAEKMATLGQMVAGVSHEINTPLGYVNNNLYILQSLLKDYNHVIDEALLLAQLLQDPEHDTSQINLSVQTLVHHAAAFASPDGRLESDQLFADTLFGLKQISELVQNLKNFSRLDEDKIKTVNLHHCIDMSLNIARSNLKNIRVIPRYRDKNLPPVRCAPAQINQVLLNLINNAAQAADKPDAHLIIDTGCTPNSIHIDLIDNGSGIERDKQQKIFEPFYTTKPAGEGTGLGLSICQKIVEEHGGKIQLDSKPGRGSVFRINLPRDILRKSDDLFF